MIGLTAGRRKARPMEAQSGPVSITSVDLTPFSLGNKRAWASGPLVIGGLLAWFMLLALIAVAGAIRIAVVLAALSLIGIVVLFLATTIQRTSASTAGRKRASVNPEHLSSRPPHFDLTFNEIFEAVEKFRSSLGGDASSVARRGATTYKRIRAAAYIVLGLIIVLAGIPLLFAMRLGGALLGPGVILLVVGMYAMFTRARRVLQPSAELATRDDTRPPILFL